jgi:hypothetical protein
MFTVDTKSLKSAVLAVEKSREKPNKHGRDNLQGIYLHVENGLLSVVAADGFRLSVATVDTNATRDVSAILNAAQLVKVARSLKSGAIDVHPHPEQWSINNVYVRTIDATFPDYQQIMPDTRELFEHRIDAPALVNAVKPLASKACAPHVTHIFADVHRAAYAVTAKCEAYPSYSRWLSAEQQSPDAQHVVTLDARFIMDTLAHEKGAVSVYFQTSTKPIVIESGRVKHVIMPMTMGGDYQEPRPIVTNVETAPDVAIVAQEAPEPAPVEVIAAHAAPVARFCGDCGTEHEPSDKFCGNCGAHIGHEAPAPVAQEAPKYGDWEGLTDAELDTAIFTLRQKYSAKNVARILSAYPRATDVRGFHQWLKDGRCVRKGEKGIMIYTPAGRYSTAINPMDGEDEGKIRVKKAYVFDITQTDPIAPKTPRTPRHDAPATMHAYAAD